MKSATGYREKLGEISSVMTKIHKMLMEDEMEARELANNKQIPPAERLNALLNDPTLSWLRAMSQLMAYVDEVYFQKEPILDRQMIDVEEKVQNLFGLQNESEFTYRYKSRLGVIPNLMIEHGNLRLVLRKVPSNNQVN
jgi:hypothetical protein